jgi:hypothetical protein
MAGIVRLAGISEGSVDCKNGRASFVLQFNNGQTLTCLSSLYEIEDMAGGLAKIAQLIRRSTPQTTLARNVLAYTVERPSGGAVLLRLVTPGGVSHTYAIPTDAVEGIASRLATERDSLPPDGPPQDL